MNYLLEINDLKRFKEKSIEKWRRNYRLYNNTPGCSLENMKDPSSVGMYTRRFRSEADTSEALSLNIIRSCVDTLVSKISENTVRPFFNTVNGSFKDITVCKQAQQFFDVLYDEQNVNKTVSETFKDACIFNTGVIYIDEDNIVINKALPFQVFVRPAEATYNKITRIYYERKDYPVTLLPEKIYKKFKRKNLDYVDYGIYYDTVNKVKVYTANDRIVLEEEYNKEVVPFVFLYYSVPTFGTSGLSIADMLRGIQEEINILMDKIKTASQLNPALTFFVPEGSTVKTGQINNRIGNVVSYKPIGGMGGSPVTSVTPAFIDNQYITLLNDLVQKAYEMVGISMLSAQSKKPTGIESGIGLATLENVESDRFETQLKQVIHAYVDIAKIFIKVIDKDKEVLPSDKMRIAVKWGDIVESEQNFNIQFSSADSLSKDPSIKLQQLQALAQAGVIQTSRIAQLMELPDLESGYNIAQNSMNAVMRVIEACVSKDVYEIPDFIPIELVKEECTNAMLSLYASNENGKNDEDIEKLMKLYEMALDKETALQEPVEEPGSQDEITEETTTEEVGQQTTERSKKTANAAKTTDNDMEGQLKLFPEDDSNYVSGDWTTNNA